jgi:MFS family permease
MTDDRERRTNQDKRLGEIETREVDVEAPTREVAHWSGTFASFRHRDYTLFWSGAFVSNIGTWMQNYALGLVVYSFRSSEFDLGVVSFLSGIPVLFLALWAGGLADRVDRKRLIIRTQAVLLVQATALGWLYGAGQLSSRAPIASLAWVSGLGILGGIMAALAFPSWQSMLPDLVSRDSLLNAIALNSAQFQSARLLGPVLGGALFIAGVTMGGIFYVNAASFLFVIWALWVIRPRKQEHHAAFAGDTGWRRLTAGLRYARENRVVRVLILSTALMTVFAMPYMMLLPAVVDKALIEPSVHGLARGVMRGKLVAYVMAANGLGAVFGSLAVASLPRTVVRERIMRWSLLALALLLIVFSASRSLALTMGISACAGAALLTTNSMVNTSIQSVVPNHLRGRVMALFITSFMGLMPVSAAIFGPLGSMIGPTNAIGGGAVVLLAWAITLLLRPGLLGLERKGSPGK